MAVTTNKGIVALCVVMLEVLILKPTTCDVCSDHPCQNGGTCNATVPQEFRCLCYAGFEPPYCIDRDECEVPEICHGGECVNTVGSFHCVCGPRYTGSRCNRVVDVCATSPCKNKGTCVLREDGTHTCQCYPGYDHDNYCEDVDECKHSDVCKNNAPCINNEGSYTCLCKQGYYGDHCQGIVDECTDNPCEHGSCINDHGFIKCKCNEGYHGLYCDARSTTTTSTLPPTTKPVQSSNPGSDTGAGNDSKGWIAGVVVVCVVVVVGGVVAVWFIRRRSQRQRGDSMRDQFGRPEHDVLGKTSNREDPPHSQKY